MELNNTEKKILKTSLRLFVRKGYHGTSINDIMTELGMTKGAFYSHFKSKSELFLRLIEEFRIRFFDEMVATIVSFKGNAIEKLNRIFSFISRFGNENTDLCVFLTFLTPELNDAGDFEAELRRIYMDYQKFISLLIKQGIKEGFLKRELNAELTALTFMALNDGVLNHRWRLNKTQYVDHEAYARTFSDMFINGIRLTTPLRKNAKSQKAPYHSNLFKMTK